MTVSPAVIAVITTIGALVVPPVVSFLKRESWPSQLKVAVTGVLSVGVAAAAIAIAEPSDFALPLVTLGGLIFAGATLAYHLMFKGSEVDTALTNVGAKKTPTG